MKRRWFICMMMVCCVVGVTLFTGCESDDDDKAPAVNVTGTWDIVDSDGDTGQLKLNQAAGSSTVTGTISQGGQTLPFTSGTINGNSLTLILTVANYTLTMDATVTATTMTGTASTNQGAGGTWTGTKK